MKIFRAILIGALLAGGSFPQAAIGPLTNQRIVGLVTAGVRSDEILRVVASAPDVAFDLTPGGTNVLLNAGVSEQIIRAMAARESGAANAGLPVRMYAPAYGRVPAVVTPTTTPAERAPAIPSSPETTNSLIGTNTGGNDTGNGGTEERDKNHRKDDGPIPPPPDGRTRIFIGETSEWQASSFNLSHYASAYSGLSGSAHAGSFHMSHAGLVKLTIPVMNQINQHCQNLLIVNRPEMADLFLRLDQSTTMWARHDDMAVFNRAGEVVFVTSTHSVSKDAKRFCKSLSLARP